MINRKVIFPVVALLFTSSIAFSQTEVLKGVVNSLALYKKQQELRYLAAAKKTVDSLTKTKADSADLEKSIYRAVVYSAILYADSLNKLNQPPDFLRQTTQLVDDLHARKRIYRYQVEMGFAEHCLANTYLRRGFQQMRVSDYSNALSLLKKAQSYAPSFKQINAYIAYANNKIGNIQEAARYYTILLDTDSIRSEYVEAAINTYKSVGDTAKALQILQKGRKLLPNDRSFLLEEANIYTNRKDYKSLSALLPQLLDDNPNNADILFIAANCYDHLENYSNAESLYLKSIELNSSFFDPIFNLGLLYMRVSDIKKNSSGNKDLLRAGQWLEKASEISPNDTKCLQLLQMAYSKEGNQVQLNRINNKLKQLSN